jgi:hypothetical protein
VIEERFALDRIDPIEGSVTFDGTMRLSCACGQWAQTWG